MDFGSKEMESEFAPPASQVDLVLQHPPGGIKQGGAAKSATPGEMSGSPALPPTLATSYHWQ